MLLQLPRRLSVSFSLAVPTRLILSPTRGISYDSLFYSLLRRLLFSRDCSCSLHAGPPTGHVGRTSSARAFLASVRLHNNSGVVPCRRNSVLVGAVRSFNVFFTLSTIFFGRVRRVFLHAGRIFRRANNDGIFIIPFRANGARSVRLCTVV